MSQYVAMQWKSVGRRSPSKRPRLDATVSEAGVTEFVSSGNSQSVVVNPELAYKINMETEKNAAEQAQRQMHEFVSTFTEVCTGFTTSKKKNEELMRQVTNLESQIQEWKDQESSWEEKKQVLQSDRDAARQEASRAIFEKCDLKEKLGNAAKEAEVAKASNKKLESTIRELVTNLAKTRERNVALNNQVTNLDIQIRNWRDQKASWVEQKKVLTRDCDESWKEANRAFSENRSLEDQLEKAFKEAEDAKASAKKARSDAVKQAEDAEKTVASTKKSFKIALRNFVASLANDESKTLGDYVNKLVKEMPPDTRAPAVGSVDVTVHEGDKTVKDEVL